MRSKSVTTRRGKKLHATLAPDLHGQVREIAAIRGVSINVLVSVALQDLVRAAAHGWAGEMPCEPAEPTAGQLIHAQALQSAEREIRRLSNPSSEAKR